MLHFSSFMEKEKPWNPVCVMPGYARWWEYAEESPYYKRYIEEQWKVFDTKEKKIEKIKENITKKNVLAMTLFLSCIYVLVFELFLMKVELGKVLITFLLFIVAFISSLIIRKLLMILS